MYAAFTLLRVLLGHEGTVIPATRSSIRLGIRVTVYGANRRDIVEFEMYATFSTKGKKTLLYRNFEYVEERDNVNGSTSWRCRNARHFCSFIHSDHFYSAPSSPLPLRGAPDYSTDTVSEFHAEAHRQ